MTTTTILVHLARIEHAFVLTQALVPEGDNELLHDAVGIGHVQPDLQAVAPVRRRLALHSLAGPMPGYLIASG